MPNRNLTDFILFNVDLQACNSPYSRPVPAVDDISKDVSVFNERLLCLMIFKSNCADYR